MTYTTRKFFNERISRQVPKELKQKFPWSLQVTKTLEMVKREIVGEVVVGNVPIDLRNI